MLPIESVREIAGAVEQSQGAWAVTVDVEALIVKSGGKRYPFTAPPIFREMLLRGLDEVELTLSRGDSIRRFRDVDRKHRPWAYGAEQT